MDKLLIVLPEKKVRCSMWILFFSLVACKETIEPNGIWNVTVTGLETDCIDSREGFQKTFEYSLYYDGSYVEIKVDGESFATGQVRGCSINYESGVYLEELGTCSDGISLNEEECSEVSGSWNSSGDFRWQIMGSADVESAAGGCGDIPDEYDWYGNIPYEDKDGNIVSGAGEVMTVISSDHESIDAGCEYNMQVTGIYSM